MSHNRFSWKEIHFFPRVQKGSSPHHNGVKYFLIVHSFFHPKAYPQDFYETFISSENEIKNLVEKQSVWNSTMEAVSSCQPKITQIR